MNKYASLYVLEFWRLRQTAFFERYIKSTVGLILTVLFRLVDIYVYLTVPFRVAFSMDNEAVN